MDKIKTKNYRLCSRKPFNDIDAYEYFVVTENNNGRNKWMDCNEIRGNQIFEIWYDYQYEREEDAFYITRWKGFSPAERKNEYGEWVPIWKSTKEFLDWYNSLPKYEGKLMEPVKTIYDEVKFES